MQPPSPGSFENPEIRRNVSLKPWNTLHVEALARRLAVITNEQQLVRLCSREKIGPGDAWILGGGSNVLFRGEVEILVIKNEIRGLEITDEDERQVWITAGAGEDWHEIVTWCVDRDYGGIENLALIPGTAGAAPIQNIGAYGVELEERFESLRAFDLETGGFRVFSREECRFGYRDSIFRRQEECRYIITSVTLRLTKPPHTVEAGYRSLMEWLEGESIAAPGIDDIYRGVIAIRSSKLPDPAVLGNAGSFFKNPVIPVKKAEELRERYGEIPVYPVDDMEVKLPAGWLIEQAGWRGTRSGDVGTYDRQALVIVNYGQATGDDVWNFARKIRHAVLEKFGIDLVPEVRVIGNPKV